MTMDDVDKTVQVGGPPMPDRRSWQVTDLVTRAQLILRGQSADQQDMLDLAKALKDADQQFGYARKLLARARQRHVDDPTLRRKLRQQHALCTYKDPDLPADSRLEKALEILQEHCRATDGGGS